MTEEQIKALQDAAEAAEARAQAAEQARLIAEAQVKEKEASLAGVVDELKTERQKKNEALEKANLINPGSINVDEVVSAALAKKEQERMKEELEQAVQEFKTSKTEFQTDASGIVFDKFKQGLGIFNLSSAKSKAEARALLENAYKFLNANTSTDAGTDYSGGAANAAPVPTNAPGISTEVQSALTSAKMSPEQLKRIQDKYPDALNGLGIN